VRSLGTWDGDLGKPVDLDFVRKRLGTADSFCWGCGVWF
jgi:hypothetical protein